MDQYPWTADVFAELQPRQFVWWNFTAVRVEFVWEDVKRNRVYLFFLDKNRDRMAAIVPKDLYKSYEGRNLVGCVFSVNHFQLSLTCGKYPRYGTYSFLRNDWEIMISKDTELTPVPFCTRGLIPFYPPVSSIKTLEKDSTKKRRLIDVVGKICWGDRVKFHRRWGKSRIPSLEIFLQDGTHHVIKMELVDSSLKHNKMIIRAIKKKSIIFASRVKLIHDDQMNYLSATGLTDIVFEPPMPEADDIRRRLNEAGV